MPRQPRNDYPGAIHHVMNRGARKQLIFLDHGGRPYFHQLVAEMCQDFGLVLLAYALMPNHYHLLLRSKWGALSAAMRFLGAEYTQTINARQGWDGSLFRGRFRSVRVDGDDYLKHLIAYIHANPERSGWNRGNAWTSRMGMFDATMPDHMDMRVARRLYAGPEDYAAYERAVIAGEATGPESFDPERMWRGSESQISAPNTAFRRPSFIEALEHFERVTGVTVGEVCFVGRRRTMQWLLSWWLRYGAGLSQREVGLKLGISQQRVSQQIRSARLEARSEPAFAALMDELARWFQGREALAKAS